MIEEKIFKKNPMQIIGSDVKVTLGETENKKEFTAKPTLIKDYARLQKGLGIAGLEIWDFHEIVEDNIIEGMPQVINELHQSFIDNNLSLYETIIICNSKNLMTPLVEMLFMEVVDLFELVFGTVEIMDYMQSENDYKYCIDVIRNINGIKYKKPSPNPEIRYWDEVKAKMDEKKNGKIEFDSIYTSVLVGTGMTPKEINEMTIHQFMATFDRIQHFKNYELTMLAGLLSKVEIHPWYAGDKEEKPATISHDEVFSGSANKSL